MLTARRADRLDALAAELQQKYGVATHTIVADLSQPDASQQIAGELASRKLDDRRAGQQRRLRRARQLRQRAVERSRALHAGDGDAVLDLTYRLLPGMLERGWGRIINIASVAGMVPAPAGHTLYGASKAFVIRFSEALAAENAPKGVNVTAVCPGFT